MSDRQIDAVDAAGIGRSRRGVAGASRRALGGLGGSRAAAAMMMVMMATGLRRLLQGLQRLPGLVEIARLQRAADLVEQAGEVGAGARTGATARRLIAVQQLGEIVEGVLRAVEVVVADRVGNLLERVADVILLIVGLVGRRGPARDAGYAHFSSPGEVTGARTGRALSRAPSICGSPPPRLDGNPRLPMAPTRLPAAPRPDIALQFVMTPSSGRHRPRPNAAIR